MTPRDFVYWLQGYFEISNADQMTAGSVEIVKRHLALVFKHEIDTPDPTGELQEIHDGKKPSPGDQVYRC